MAQANIPSAQEPIISDTKKFTSAWTRYMYELWKRVGGGDIYNLGGRLTTDNTQKGNILTGEDNLITYSLPKNALHNDGDILEITAYGTTAANANNKTIDLYLGSTLLFSTGALSFNNSAWCIRCEITRINDTSEQAIATFHGDYSLLTTTATFTAGTEDLTTTLTIKCTGTGTATNDVIQRGLTIKMFPAG